MGQNGRHRCGRSRAPPRRAVVRASRCGRSPDRAIQPDRRSPESRERYAIRQGFNSAGPRCTIHWSYCRVDAGFQPRRPHLQRVPSTTGSQAVDAGFQPRSGSQAPLGNRGSRSSASSRPDVSARSNSRKVGSDRRAEPRARLTLPRFRSATGASRVARHVASDGRQTAPRDPILAYQVRGGLDE
jgi:hypothetical protein